VPGAVPRRSAADPDERPPAVERGSRMPVLHAVAIILALVAIILALIKL
jgi:hypothetical protein